MQNLLRNPETDARIHLQRVGLVCPQFPAPCQQRRHMPSITCLLRFVSRFLAWGFIVAAAIAAAGNHAATHASGNHRLPACLPAPAPARVPFPQASPSMNISKKLPGRIEQAHLPNLQQMFRCVESNLPDTPAERKKQFIKNQPAEMDSIQIPTLTAALQSSSVALDAEPVTAGHAAPSTSPA